jgi:hypothetical protein
MASRPPIFAKAGSETIKVVNITLNDPALRMSLSTLTILNSRSTDVAVPKLFKICPCSKATPKPDIKTTNRSKLLKVSAKNIRPRAMILKKDSKEKRPKKMRFP